VLSALQVCQLRHAPVARGDCVLPLPSYALWRWSGEVVTDNNLAAMSGLYSLPLGDWWPAACRAARIAPAQLPRVVTVGDVGARTTSAAGRYGLPAGLPVVLAGNDQTAGAYAARLEGTGAVLITLGTAQVVYTHCRELPAPGVGTVRGPYPGGGYYLLTCDAVGGNLVNWAETVLAGCGTDAAFFAHAARAPVGDNGLWLDVAFDGATWGWAGLRLNHTAGDLARAVIEALCRRLAILVASHGGLRARRRVFAAGGGSRQPFWRQLLARELGVRVVPTTADPLLGAARLAARQ
jgi:xylulokinase